MLKRVRSLRPESIPRRPDVTGRAVILSLGARFADELLSGLPDVLMPTIRAQLGLSLAQVGLLGLALSYVAAIIEPINGLLIDIWQRRWLMAWGAAGIALAVIVMGVAPAFAILLLGFAIYGLASGPLAHTADVILVESHPTAPDRIFARATLIDTLGALLAPLLVTLAIWMGVEWRMLMLVVGAACLVYAALILRTRFPAPQRVSADKEGSVWGELWLNVRAVVSSRQAFSWLLFLFLFYILEAPLPFKTIWLHEDAGMSQALIGLYKALELVVHVISLLFLDRWLRRTGYKRILQIANVGLLVLIPAWILISGIWPRFLLAIPLNFLLAVYWPIGKGQSLASVPGRAGTVTAVQSLFGLVPITLLFGLLAEMVSLTTAMLWVSVAALLLLVLIVWRLPDSGQFDMPSASGG